MAGTRVLIVDDSAVVRKILTEAIKGDPDLEVIGAAANGKIALQKIPLLKPDCITLDIEMPEMDGLETLVHLQQEYPAIPVIMFSSLTAQGAAATLEALARGAADYVTTPAGQSGLSQSIEAIRETLIPKIKALVGAKRSGRTTGSAPSAEGWKHASDRSRVSLVVIGTSTGGPNALAEILPCLPASLPVPVLIVQHMPPLFTRLLAERLHNQSEITVLEAPDDRELRAGTVYVAPGDFHLEVVSSGSGVRTRLHQGPKEHSCRPAVDVTLRSAVAIYGPKVLGVILTGMGKDGSVGAECVKKAGGVILVQDQATSVVWGMPGQVTQLNLADEVLPVGRIAERIVSMVGGQG